MNKSNKKRSKKSASNTKELIYNKLKVAELEDLCRKRKLTVSCLKANLVSRLEKYDSNQAKKRGGSEAREEPANASDLLLNEEEDEATDAENSDAVIAALEKTDSEKDDDYNNSGKISSRDVIAEAVENDM